MSEVLTYRHSMVSHTLNGRRDSVSVVPTMAINLTVARIDRALPFVAAGLGKYLWLQEHRDATDLRVDFAYRRYFNHFYRVRRGHDWQDKFYGLLEAQKSRKVDFAQLLHALHQRTGRYEASFASKLLATINPDMPVIDSVVLRNLDLRLPARARPSVFSSPRSTVARRGNQDPPDRSLGGQGCPYLKDPFLDPSPMRTWMVSPSTTRTTWPLSMRDCAWPRAGASSQLSTSRLTNRMMGRAPLSVTRGPPGVDDGPEPKSQQETYKDDQVGPDWGCQQRQRVGDRSTEQPTQHAGPDRERRPLDRLAIVELSQAGEDSCEDQGNELASSPAPLRHSMRPRR
jgi:hypothetical protein